MITIRELVDVKISIPDIIAMAAPKDSPISPNVAPVPVIMTELRQNNALRQLRYKIANVHSSLSSKTSV